MIIIRIIGGLGNQMFQYAIAKSIANKNNTIFKLDISFYPKQTLRKYELGLFNIDEKIATSKECIMLRGKEGILFKILKKLKLLTNNPTTYIKEKQNTIFDKDIYERKDNIYLDGFWQNEKYFIDIRKQLINDFTIKKEISNEAKFHLNKIFNTNSISLHVRRGDYILDSHINSIHGICSIDYYKKSTQYMEKEINNPTFFIFSDDIKWCKENFNFLSQKVFIDDTKNALEDLELMKQCKHNIIANSTFSWWGAWLNTNKNKIVISPIEWIKNNTESSKWVPDNWIQL